MIGSTVSPSSSPRRSRRALTEPSTTGLTISRCDGLNDRLRWTGPPAVAMSLEKPWWYLTSPEGRLSGAVWSNSANRSFGILPSVLTSTFRRPRCAMPITISCTPLAPRALHEFVHRGDEALAAFEREALLADVLGVQVALEAFGRGQAVEDVELLLGVNSGLERIALQPLLPPALLGRLGDVHVLGADRAAVGFAQRLHDLAQRHVLGGREVGVGGAEHHVHVGLGEVVERRLELGNLRPLGALERVEVGPARAERAIGRDQRLDMDLLARDGEVVARSAVAEGVGLGALRERFDDRRMGDVAGGRSRRRRERAAGRRSRCASCRGRSRGCRDRPRTALRRTARCRRTGTSSHLYSCIISLTFHAGFWRCSGLKTFRATARPPHGSRPASLA